MKVVFQGVHMEGTPKEVFLLLHMMKGKSQSPAQKSVPATPWMQKSELYISSTQQSGGYERYEYGEAALATRFERMV